MAGRKRLAGALLIKRTATQPFDPGHLAFVSPTQHAGQESSIRLMIIKTMAALAGSSGPPAPPSIEETLVPMAELGQRYTLLVPNVLLPNPDDLRAGFDIVDLNLEKRRGKMAADGD